MGGVVLESDVFAGTSQARGVRNHSNDLQVDPGGGGYGNGFGCHGDGGFVDGDELLQNAEVRMEGVVNQRFLGSVKPLPQPHPPAPPQGYSTEQLEILYRGKERQVEELSQQLLAVKQDGELHIRLLREKIVRIKKYRNFPLNGYLGFVGRGERRAESALRVAAAKPGGAG